jgi:putative DNA methylase
MTDFPRLIEHAFPLKQASLDSVHEKNVRHGHISTLHIWPARRPLAACRAALIATLLPDPGDAEKRKALCERIGGRVVKKVEKKKMPGGQTVERVKEETEGGILHWLESEPDKSNKKKWREWKARSDHYNAELEWFRQEIRKAYGGRAPKVLDPFAGGGAIPLEAMRLGCEATAVDINPVAWFILKCTLEYPQKLAGQTRPLPDFILHDDAFMGDFFKKAKGYSKAETTAALKRLHTSIKKKTKPGEKQADAGLPFGPPEGADEEIQADLAWHVRAWGQWVLAGARRELAEYYPMYADFEPVKKGQISYERQPMRLVPLTEAATPDIESLNADFSDDYLADGRNPRWVAKPTVAYLWARTTGCKNCRATIPLLKTRWVARTNSQRVILDISPNAAKDGVEFSLRSGVPKSGGNNAQRREHDRKVGLGTMSRSGVKCPCCGAIMTLEDLQVEGKAGRLDRMMTAVAVKGRTLKEFRRPTERELECARPSMDALDQHFDGVPFGLPEEHLVEDAKRNTWCVQYGIDQFNKLFTERQLASMAVLTRGVRKVPASSSEMGYPAVWGEALSCYLATSMSRLADFFNCGAQWKLDRATINHLFVRYALPVSWDFAEGNALGDLPGSHDICLKKIAVALDAFVTWAIESPPASALQCSALSGEIPDQLDAIVTDPPYYNAIGYAVLMDYFYVWLRRQLHGLTPEFDRAFATPLTPKWDNAANDGELVDDASRHGGDAEASKRSYEHGMEQVFTRCARSLKDDGRLVIVFANKQPDAWETLVAAIIRAGFLVEGSWPIQTEQASRMRAQSSSALASSVWLVCKRRNAAARPGWDNRVLDEMREHIAVQLREFWDAGIRGPDFVWAATGPALEAYSKHPVVRKANEPNATMSVGEFLNHVRRMVVDYIVGQVLTGEQGADMSAADRLDEVTAYYLLHRHDFGLNEAPVGACILYATACGLSDSELERTWDILSGGGKASSPPDDFEDSDDDNDDGDGEADADSGTSGGKVKLKAWSQRKGRSMGFDAPEGKAVPLIDRIHRLMHMWKAGDQHKVDEYIDEHSLRNNELFKRVVQSLIELSSNSERSLLESISNHIGAKGAVTDRGPQLFETKTSSD